MTQFPKTRAEQFALASDPKTRHLAVPAPGVDPDWEELWATLGPAPAAPVIETKYTPDLMGKLTGRDAT